MLKSTCIALVFALALALGTALIAMPTGAQEQTYYTYVAEGNVPRGQWAAFEKERDQQNAALQHLVADGSIIAWGRCELRAHRRWLHAWGFLRGHQPRRNSEGARDAAAARNRGCYTSVTKRKDMFLHTMAHGGKTSSATTGYIRVGSWVATPGEGDALTEHVKNYVLPMLGADIADGTVLMHHFDTEDIHTDAQGSHILAVMYPSGEAMDRAYSRLAASMKDNPAVGEMVSNFTVSAAHRDYLGRISAYQYKIIPLVVPSLLP
jgi:hypothetical protein